MFSFDPRVISKTASEDAFNPTIAYRLSVHHLRLSSNLSNMLRIVTNCGHYDYDYRFWRITFRSRFAGRGALLTRVVLLSRRYKRKAIKRSFSSTTLDESRSILHLSLSLSLSAQLENSVYASWTYFHTSRERRRRGTCTEGFIVLTEIATVLVK